jgi:hypothetical protein
MSEAKHHSENNKYLEMEPKRKNLYQQQQGTKKQKIKTMKNHCCKQGFCKSIAELKPPKAEAFVKTLLTGNWQPASGTWRNSHSGSIFFK